MSHKLKIIILIGIVVVVLAGGATTTVILNKETSPQPFSVSGVVSVDGMPVEGVTVSCSATETTTDQDGFYCLSGLFEETTISFSSQDYFFPQVTTVFSSDTTFDCTDGMAYRTVSGKCTNGNEPVPDVQVTLCGQNKTYITFSDDDGNFSVDNLAGDVEVSAIKDGKQLFSQVSPNNSIVPLEIVSTSSFSVEFDFGDEDLTQADFVCIYDGKEYDVSTANGNFVIECAEYGKKFSLFSDTYAFDTSEFTVTSRNDLRKVRVYQKYSLSGNVSCGISTIENASVFLDGKVVAVTDESGNYSIEPLYGKHDVQVVCNGYISQSRTVTKNDRNFSPNLQKQISIKVYVGEKQLNGATILVGENVYLSTNGGAKINCVNGENIAVAKEGYRFEEPISVENNKNEYVVNGYKIYSARLILSGTELSDDISADVLSDGNIVVGLKQNLSENAVNFVDGVVVIDSVYDIRNVAIDLPNYRVKAGESVSDASPSLAIEAKLLHNLDGVVRSGELAVDKANLYVNNQYVCQSDADGKFQLEIAQGDILTIKAQGYDTLSKTYAPDEETKNVNLTYSIDVSAMCGQNLVRNYTIKYDGETKIVSGKFKLEKLSGSKTIVIEKEGYEFYFENGSNSVQVVSNGVYQAQALFEAKIVVSKAKNPVEGATVIVADNDSGKTERLTTSSDGSVVLTKLNSVYTAIVCDYDGVRFRPDSIEISESGTYSFADSGYSVTVKVQVGESPLGDTEITYGGHNAITNDSGEYKLNLSENTTVSLSKEGYAFDNSTFEVTEDDDGKTINIFATYSISGKVTSGNFALANVGVSAGTISTTTDEQGNYTLSGIGSLSEQITFEKDGFTKVVQVVSGYQIVNINMFVDVEFAFVSGDIALDNVLTQVNGTTTNEFSLGDAVEFVKEGYSFETVTIDGTRKIEVQGSYSVSGTVKNGSDGVSNVSVCVGNAVVATTDENGRFIVDGLCGEITLTFTSSNYKFSSVVVNKPANSIVVTASYDVTIKVLSDGKPLEDVSVSVRNVSLGKTSEDGLLFISELTGKNTIVLSKKGYSFEGDSVVTQGAEVVFTATYTISGTVYVGNTSKTASNINIYSNGEYCYTTGANGSFSIEGLQGQNELTFSCDGYKTQKTIVAQPQSLSVNIGFYVVVTFDGNDGGAITATANGQKIAITDDTTTLGEFYEVTEIEFSKDGWAFDIPMLTVSDYTQKKIALGKAFAISGKVTTTSGVPVVGMTMYAGNQTTETDFSGNYSFSSLMGEVQVRGSYKYTINGKNLYTHDCSVNDATKYSNDAVVNFSSVSDSDYAFALYERNYDVRLGQYGNTPYKITGGGGVKAVAVGTTTKTSGGYIKIKDENGNIITENSNFGETIMGIDPRVAVLSYYNGSSVKYASITGDKVSGSIDPAKVSLVNYSGATFTNCTDSELKSMYGSSVHGIVIYNVNQNTVSSSSVKSNSNGTITLTMTLTTEQAMYSNYATQINKLSGVTMKEFEKEVLTFTLDANGYVTQMVADESYKVEKKVGVTVTADTTATLTYNYTYENITDLSSFSTDNAVIQKLLGR